MKPDSEALVTWGGISCRKHVRGVMETAKYVRQSSSRSSVESRSSSIYFSDGESDADSVCG